MYRETARTRSDLSSLRRDKLVDVRRAFLCWLAIFAIPAWPASSADWRLTRSDHFEVYAQISDRRALAILTWLEQLRAFFEPSASEETGAAAPVRVIVFASEQEYQPYRLRATADAYYVGTSGQDYIVMGTDDPARFGLVAHEYAHLALRASGLKLLPWLSEGLADFFATLRIGEHAVEIGGALPARIHTLRSRAWMPLSDLLALSEDAHSRQERAAADLFYSESWALVEMLAISPEYAPGFQKLVARIAAGDPSPQALSAVYSKTLDAMTRDLHRWVDQATQPVVELQGLRPSEPRVSVSDVTPSASRLLLAQLLLAAGEFERAQSRLLALAEEVPESIPESAEVQAALGTIALHGGDTADARRAWKRAIQLGIADARLCYHYAILADQAGLPADDIRPALERAIALQPHFDDAHYQLALLEKNAGHYEAALREFHAMQDVSDARAYAYWLALADTYNELGRREEARAAAQYASDHAATSAERARAARQIYIAQTDPRVQFARDASGQLQLVTTRVPHGQSDWNPFIELGDEIYRVQGTLRGIECGAVTSIQVQDGGKLLKLVIPDLQHVQMRHAPPDFVCGPQTPTPVTVDYARTPNSAHDGIVRGMDFTH